MNERKDRKGEGKEGREKDQMENLRGKKMSLEEMN